MSFIQSLDSRAFQCPRFRLDQTFLSCLAVMQGISWRAVWDKQLHRLLGTAIGLLLSWALLALPPGAWAHSLLMIVLAFVIEVAVVRHYGFAAIFFTPLTILLADAPTLGQGPTNALIAARFFDTVLGCLVGLLGGYALHSPRFRHAVGITMRQVIAKLR